jgi:FAD/FMN-containing dehydrogenase
MTGMYGLAVDNLISARIVTATRGLVIASETENPDLFWALKGAGQYFGIVTEVTVKIFPFREQITTWSCVFLPSQIMEVSAVLETLANGDDAVRSPGMAAIMAFPGQTTVRTCPPFKMVGKLTSPAHGASQHHAFPARRRSR